jgi:hypothetical protein
MTQMQILIYDILFVLNKDVHGGAAAADFLKHHRGSGSIFFEDISGSE